MLITDFRFRNNLDVLYCTVHERESLELCLSESQTSATLFITSPATHCRKNPSATSPFLKKLQIRTCEPLYDNRQERRCESELRNIMKLRRIAIFIREPFGTV